MFRLSAIMISIFCAHSISAQEHPFLSRFELTETESGVLIGWTMIAGGTCDGTRIMRSTDSLHFEAIGGISGICGDISQPVDYQFLDRDPPELSTVFYRIELGSNGNSSIKRIDLQLLRSIDHRFRPNPVSDQGELLLRISTDQRAEIIFFNAIGKEIHRINASGGRHPIDVRHWPAGLHFYHVISGDQRSIGKFVVQ